MNEAAATSFPAALLACMEAGCGKKLNADGFAAPWTQRMLAEEVEVSDRAVRQWLGGERTPDSKNFQQLLFILSPKDCPHQRAAYEQLKANRPPTMVTQQRRRQSTTAEPQPIPPDARPYRGLEAFREEDTHLFFGRDALARNVLDKLDHHRLVLLIGASGSGKSSLINAGIIPKLRQDPARTIVRCTPGDRAIANLAAALARTLDPDRSPAELRPAQQTYKKQLEADPEAIRDIAQLLPEGRLFLVIDQFEETFTLTRPANPKQHDVLIATLLAIARSPDERKLNALLGMRSDFQNELETADPELIQRLDNAMVQMRAMHPAEREAAITEPARAYGVALEPGLLTAITADLADNRDALPLLEVALDELWSRRDDTSRRLTLAAFTEIGGIPGALGQRADRALEHIGLDETLVRRLFLELVRVDPEGASTRSTRRPRTRQELGEELWQLGERLAAPGLRLLVTYRDDTIGEQILDVTHEAIFRQWQRLASWIEEERDFLLFCQRLDQRLADYMASGGDRDYRLPQRDLERADDWQKAGKAFRRDQHEYIAGSTESWAQDAADDAAHALWGRLELSFGDWLPTPEHDWDTLSGLWTAEADTIRRLLLLATVEQDSARKFNRRPSLMLRAALGLDPATAIARAAPAQYQLSAEAILETGLAGLTLARHLAPVANIDAARTIDRALTLTGMTTTLFQPRALSHTIAALADQLNREAATRTVDRALALAGKTTDSSQLETLAHTVGVLAGQLDREAATRVVDCISDLAGMTTSPSAPQALARVIAALAGHLDREAATRTVDRAIALAGKTTAPGWFDGWVEAIAALAGHLDRDAATRTVDRAIALAGKTTNRFQFHALTQAIAALAGKLDHEAATRSVDLAIDQAGRTTDAFQLKALAQAIAAPAGNLDHGVIHGVAIRILDRAIALVGEMVNLNALQAIAQGIAALSGTLDRDAATHAIDRAIYLASKTTDPFQFQILAECIAILTERLDPEAIRLAATRTVDRAIVFAGKTTDPARFHAWARAIAALAGNLDPEASYAAATRVVDRTIELAGNTVDPRQLQAMAQVIAAFADKVHRKAIRDATTGTVDRVIDLAREATNPDRLNLLAQAIAALAGVLESTATCEAATRTVDRALAFAVRTDIPNSLRALSRAIDALAPQLPAPAVVIAAIELLKHPLGGDEKVTETLLGTITTALARPDLLRPFPEQSFWAVMQHLAELKAANPDWDWLDLARPPLPPDELVATFRRLCADPPDWPTT